MSISSSLKVFTTLTLSMLIIAGCKKANDSMSITSESSESEMRVEGMKIAEAMKNGTPLACTITTTDTTENTTHTMNYIVQGKKFKMDTQQPAQEGQEATMAHVISDGEFAYTWVDGQNEGMKFTILSEADMEKSAETGNEALRDLPDFSSEEKIEEYEQQGYSISCDETTVETNTFTPPANVTFRDLSVMMKDTMNEAMEGVSEEQRKQIEDAMKQYGN